MAPRLANDCGATHYRRIREQLCGRVVCGAVPARLPLHWHALACPHAPGPKDMTGVIIPAAAWLPGTASPAPTATRTPGPPSVSPSPSAVPVLAPASGAVVVAMCFVPVNVSALGACHDAIASAPVALTTAAAFAPRCAPLKAPIMAAAVSWVPAKLTRFFSKSESVQPRSRRREEVKCNIRVLLSLPLTAVDARI